MLKGKSNPFGMIPIQRLFKENFSPPSRACRRDAWRRNDKCQPSWSVEACPSRKGELGSLQFKGCPRACELLLGINNCHLHTSYLTALQEKLPLEENLLPRIPGPTPNRGVRLWARHLTFLDLLLFPIKPVPGQVGREHAV